MVTRRRRIALTLNLIGVHPMTHHEQGVALLVPSGDDR